jgi:hypothetical protein
MKIGSQKMSVFELAVNVNFPELVKKFFIQLKKTRKTVFLLVDTGPSTT